MIGLQDVEEIPAYELQESLKYMNIELTEEQKINIKRFYGRTFLYRLRKKKPKSSFLFRLSYPLYLLLYAILIISIPFKWLFTGVEYYSSKSWVSKLMVKWNRKLF